MSKRALFVGLVAGSCAPGPSGTVHNVGPDTGYDEFLNTTTSDDTGGALDDGFSVQQTPGESCVESETAWPVERWDDPAWDAQTVTTASAVAPTSAWGVALGDFDGDGLSDAYLPQIGFSQLFINEGRRRWRNASDWAVDAGPSAAIAATAVDFDDDGDLDVVETGLGLSLIHI